MMLKTQCMLCPRNCKADRKNGQKGYCGATDKIQVARASLHMWEEPCISGDKGSGTIFFSGCPLRCIFCQNRDIALGNKGIYLSESELSAVFLRLQEKGAHNINLVTPTHFVPQIVCALNLAKEKGLKIPIVYNTGSYEKTETIQQLEGLVDIYLPDLKYISSKLSSQYSNAPDYFVTADRAIAEMVHQIGKPVFAGNIMRRGVIVRHMVIPGHTNEAKEIISHLYYKYGNDIYISILNQYTPHGDLTNYPEIARTVTRREYQKVVDYAITIGVENAFIQEGNTAKESFIPDFDELGLLEIPLRTL